MTPSLCCNLWMLSEFVFLLGLAPLDSAVKERPLPMHLVLFGLYSRYVSSVLTFSALVYITVRPARGIVQSPSLRFALRHRCFPVGEPVFGRLMNSVFPEVHRCS